jgi:hypothetical protein
MMPRSGMTAPSPGALRMRRSRERCRQGDVMVSLKVGPNMTAALVDLGWLPTSDRVDKDTIALALVGFIERAITMRATPSTMESESGCFTPLPVTAGPIAIGFDENAPQSPRLERLPSGAAHRHLALGVLSPARFSVQPKSLMINPQGTGSIPHCRLPHSSLTWSSSTPSSRAPNRLALSLGPSRLSRSRSTR